MITMSDRVLASIEVFPDLSFHLFVDGNGYYGLTRFRDIELIIQREKTKIKTCLFLLKLD